MPKTPFKHGSAKRKQELDRNILLKPILDTVSSVMQRGHYLDKAIEQTMRKHKGWGVKERSFVAETVRDIIRYWRLVLAAANLEESTCFLPHNFYQLVGVIELLRGADPLSYKSLKSFPVSQVKERLIRFKNNRKIRESYPDWLDQRMASDLGEKWEEISVALNKSPALVLRTNRIKCNPEDLLSKLQEEHVQTEPLSWAPDALALPFSRNVFRTEAFHEGWFEVQDPASQMVSIFLAPKPGERVVDACAGSGGKSLHIAALMKNKGKIIALDTKDFKLTELRKRASRAGATIIEAKVVENTKTIKRLQGTADRLLIDAPCSGLGVLRRNPDAKWKLQPDELKALAKQQSEILNTYSTLLKPNGTMVYAVCSLLPSEGKEQITHFLSEHSDQWQLEAEQMYWPHQLDCDGFYMAKLIKRPIA
jgi:16S rRNA (cytosine967-C5)-methyltransferase